MLKMLISATTANKEEHDYTTEFPRDIKEAMAVFNASVGNICEYANSHDLDVRHIDADLYENGNLTGYANWNALTGKYSYEGILKGVA